MFFGSGIRAPGPPLVTARTRDAEFRKKSQMFCELLPRVTHRVSAIESSILAKVGRGDARQPPLDRRSRIFDAISVFICIGSSTSPIGREQEPRVGVGVEAGSLARDVVGDDEIDLLRRELAARARTGIAGLGGETDEQRRPVRPSRVPELREDVGRAHQASSSSGPSDLAIFADAGPRSGM